MTELQEKLFALQDKTYRDFQCRLIPNVKSDTVIGVRTPELRRLAKTVDMQFRNKLPHDYFEENQIHGFSLERMKDFDAAVEEVNSFLPFVDNWANCDQMNPKVFRKHRAQLLPHIRCWLASGHPYTVRFGIKMLMDHFLDEDFDSVYPEMVAAVRHEDYYVRMMVAWYFATALAKQYDAVLPYITDYRLEKWIHNKTIQKAVESYRITADRKEFLKNYRIK